MLTKYVLHTPSEDYELTDSDLRNWDEIKCSCKRSGIDGVVRSFSSQFEFVNTARDILFDLFVSNGYNAEASISVLTSDDNWEYEERFGCPLDFSTISWDSPSVIKINSVDNSLSALINANKGTKYELVIGEDVRCDNIMHFDRLIMSENISFEFTQGTDFPDCADMIVSFRRGELPWVGNVGSEISVNGSVYWQDDQTTDADSYLLKIENDVEVWMDYDLAWRTDTVTGRGFDLGIRVIRNGIEMKPSPELECGIFCQMRNRYLERVAVVSNPSELPDPSKVTNPVKEQVYALVGGKVWRLQPTYITGVLTYQWKETGMTEEEMFTTSVSQCKKLNLKAGDTVVLYHELVGLSDDVVSARFSKSSFVFTWKARGQSVDIDVIRPSTLARTLLQKMAGASVNTEVLISDFDPRLRNTYIMAAESARAIEGAKIYSTFTEFCDWMSAVFGYVYYIGELRLSKYVGIKECGQYEWSPWAYEDAIYPGVANAANIVYIPTHARFLYLDPNSSKLYARWQGWEDYNGSDGHPRTDTLFRIIERSRNALYYFDEYKGEPLYPIEYELSAGMTDKDSQTVCFVHRTELFGGNEEPKKIRFCRDLTYSIDASLIYSSVTVGYEKKDYNNINGRDEFNFSNTYTTGCTVTDKEFKLLSKYRADSYGIEFACQKRGEDTTDSASDTDVFFVLCTATGDGTLIPDRSIKLREVLSDTLFNGAFCPMACAMANEGYIGMQSKDMTLKFASSTGNSSAIIGEMYMTDPLTLSNPLASCATIEFTSDDLEVAMGENDLLEVESEGMTYRGYLKEVEYKYAREEEAKYKLIVKDFE